MKSEHRQFSNARFSPEVIKEAANIFDTELKSEGTEDKPALSLYVEIDRAGRMHDTEAEFYADYRRSEGGAWYERTIGLRDH